MVPYGAVREDGSGVATVDLGCGANKRGDIGIDIYPHPNVDIICHLGFEAIPLDDDSVDNVVAYDFIEHLPVSVYYREHGVWKVHRPRIFLMREIHRILKPGGRFESFTPNYPHATWAQDPTHEAPPWCRETWPYFCGTWPELTRTYGIDFHFRMLHMQEEGGHLRVIVEKP